MCHEKPWQILDAVVWRWCHCMVMVIFKRHVAPVNHRRLRKYFTITHTAPTGTIFISRQIEWFTLKKKYCYNLMHPSHQHRRRSVGCYGVLVISLVLIVDNAKSGDDFDFGAGFDLFKIFLTFLEWNIDSFRLNIDSSPFSSSIHG